MHRIIPLLKQYLMFIIGILLPWQIYIHIHGNIDVSLTVLLVYILILLNINIFFGKDTIRILKKNWGILFYFLLVLLFTLNIIRSQGNLKEAIKINGFLWLGPLLYLVFKQLNIATQKKIIFLIIIFSLPMLIMSILQGLSGSLKSKIFHFPIMKFFIEPNTLSDLLHNTYKINILNNSRGGGFFVNANKAALYYNFILAISLYFIFTSKNKIKNIIIFTITIINLFAILLTYSLSGSATAALIILLFLILNIKKKNYSSFIILLGIVLVVILGFTFTKRLPSKFKKYKEIKYDSRIVVWSSSVAAYKKNWLFGYGFQKEKWKKAYLENAQKYHINYFLPPHNLFLNIGRYVGILGIIFQLLFFYYYFIRIKHLNEIKDIQRNNLILGVLIVFTFFFQGLFAGTNPIILPRIGMLFWILLSFSDNLFDSIKVNS